MLLIFLLQLLDHLKNQHFLLMLLSIQIYIAQPFHLHIFLNYQKKISKLLQNHYILWQILIHYYILNIQLFILNIIHL